MGRMTNTNATLCEQEEDFIPRFEDLSPRDGHNQLLPLPDGKQ